MVTHQELQVVSIDNVDARLEFISVSRGRCRLSVGNTYLNAGGRRDGPRARPEELTLRTQVANLRAGHLGAAPQNRSPRAKRPLHYREEPRLPCRGDWLVFCPAHLEPMPASGGWLDPCPADWLFPYARPSLTFARHPDTENPGLHGGTTAAGGSLRGAGGAGGAGGALWGGGAGRVPRRAWQWWLTVLLIR
jgi:hypothetical protein